MFRLNCRFWYKYKLCQISVVADRIRKKTVLDPDQAGQKSSDSDPDHQFPSSHFDLKLKKGFPNNCCVG